MVEILKKYTIEGRYFIQDAPRVLNNLILT